MQNKGLRSHSGIQYSEDLLWGRGTPIYVLDRHEPPDRVWFHPGGGGGYSFIIYGLYGDVLLNRK